MTDQPTPTPDGEGVQFWRRADITVPDLMKLRRELAAAKADAERMATALRDLNDACWIADKDGDLSSWIQGDLLTAADAALAAHAALGRQIALQDPPP
jgi:glutathione S-transferase